MYFVVRGRLYEGWMWWMLSEGSMIPWLRCLALNWTPATRQKTIIIMKKRLWKRWSELNRCKQAEGWYSGLVAAVWLFPTVCFHICALKALGWIELNRCKTGRGLVLWRTKQDPEHPRDQYLSGKPDICSFIHITQPTSTSLKSSQDSIPLDSRRSKSRRTSMLGSWTTGRSWSMRRGNSKLSDATLGCRTVKRLSRAGGNYKYKHKTNTKQIQNTNYKYKKIQNTITNWEMRLWDAKLSKDCREQVKITSTNIRQIQNK